MEQVKKFSFDVGWVLISSVVALPIGFLLSIFLARWLAALGLYQMVITVQGIAVLVATLGIPAALIKYVAEYKDVKEKLTQTVSSGLLSSILFGILVGILLYALSGTLAGIFHMPELARLLKILAFALPFISLFQALTGLLNGLREMKIFASLLILQSILMIAFIIAFVGLGFGVEGAVFGIVLSVVGGCVFGLYRSRRFVHLSLQGFVQNAKKLVLFGSQMFGANAMGLVLAYTDIILIGYFLAAKDVGYYSVAVSLSMFFLIIPQAIQAITYPTTSEYWSKNNHQALQQMINKSMRYSACILLPLGLGVGFFSREIITTIFGGEFIYAVLPLCVLLIARVIGGSTEISIGGSFSGVGRPDLALKIDATSAGVNVGLNILLIPRFGILGAAIATTASLLLGTIIFLALIPKILTVRIDIKWFAWTMGLAGIAVALFLGGTQLINHYVVGSVILCAYIVLVFKLFLTKEDKGIFRYLAYSLITRR